MTLPAMEFIRRFLQHVPPMDKHVQNWEITKSFSIMPTNSAYQPHFL
jgi:hypothetical protein